VSIKPIKIRLSGNTQKQEDKEEAEREGEGTKESQNGEHCEGTDTEIRDAA